MDKVESFEQVCISDPKSHQQLLDYVYTDEDVSDAPSIKEYKKMTRVMKVMVRFYVRGEVR
jgi:hypothetical protein